MSSSTAAHPYDWSCIIDQADPDSIPTRIQFTGTNGNTWTAYGVESLPYITQMYPIAGTSPLIRRNGQLICFSNYGTRTRMLPPLTRCQFVCGLTVQLEYLPAAMARLGAVPPKLL